jgi:hypothetical protein
MNDATLYVPSNQLMTFQSSIFYSQVELDENIYAIWKYFAYFSAKLKPAFFYKNDKESLC